jgi:hypothetical protein
MHFPVGSRLKHLSLVAVGTAATFLALAGSASAASVVGGSLPHQTDAGNGAITLTYGGHSYICYRGDLCVYRGGHYEAYYACRTVTNTATADGWAVNNQFGAGSTATFYSRPGSGFTTANLGADDLGVAHWRGIRSFRVCT